MIPTLERGKPSKHLKHRLARRRPRSSSPGGEETDDTLVMEQPLSNAEHVVIDRPSRSN